jgi:hypothetical protein
MVAALLELCPVSHKRWSVPSTVALSAEAGIPGVGVPENGRTSSRHFGWGDLGAGIVLRIKPAFWYKRSVGASRTTDTLRFRGSQCPSGNVIAEPSEAEKLSQAFSQYPSWTGFLAGHW